MYLIDKINFITDIYKQRNLLNNTAKTNGAKSLNDDT